jgi:hypothetical protein
MDNATKQILELITNIQEEMVVKDDFKDLATKGDLEKRPELY